MYFSTDQIDNENRTALHWASRLGFEVITDLLINSGANINKIDKLQRSPLHLASKNGSGSIKISSQ